MGTPAQSAQFTRSALGPHRHICAFFNSIDEQHRVLRPFIAEGFADGERPTTTLTPGGGKNTLAGWPKQAST